MARPREFDSDEVIQKAMSVFWENGYTGASLPDLLTGMGLTRGSLYKAFSDKKNLFLRVLEHYEAAAVDKAVEILTDAAVPDGRQRILNLFKVLYGAVERGDARGCLLCTAAAGSEMADPEIAAAVHQGLKRLRDGMENALVASPAHRGQSDDVRRDIANVLLTQYIGLRVLARSQLPLGIFEESISGIERLLDLDGAARAIQ